LTLINRMAGNCRPPCICGMRPFGLCMTPGKSVITR
jgi:hypothetical protein